MLHKIMSVAACEFVGKTLMAERTEIEGHAFILSAPSESGRAYLCHKPTGAMFGIGDKVAANAFHACEGLTPELIDDVLRLLPRIGTSSNDDWSDYAI